MALITEIAKQSEITAATVRGWMRDLFVAGDVDITTLAASNDFWLINYVIKILSPVLLCVWKSPVSIYFHAGDVTAERRRRKARAIHATMNLAALLLSV